MLQFSLYSLQACVAISRMGLKGENKKYSSRLAWMRISESGNPDFTPIFSNMSILRKISKVLLTGI